MAPWVRLPPWRGSQQACSLPWRVSGRRSEALVHLPWNLTLSALSLTSRARAVHSCWARCSGGRTLRPYLGRIGCLVAARGSGAVVCMALGCCSI